LHSRGFARRHSFLDALNPEQAAALFPIAREVKFQPGETIFRQRDNADGFYLIETGEVNLEFEMPGNKRVPIQKLGPGELLGLSWLFEPYRWEFSATAADEVSARFLSAAEVRAACDRDPRLGHQLMTEIARVLTKRLQATRHRLRVFVERASADDEDRQVC
jgi:CRP-like cAMP-binding protein